MSPRIAYWTSAFEPDMEAIAGQVALLRKHFPSSLAWGLSHRHWALFSPRRGYCLHPRLHLLFRAVTRVLEPAFQLNHIVGSLGDWFYLVGVRRRPTILTMAAMQPPVAPKLLDSVDRFVAEYPAGRDYLEGLGIARNRIRVILPPVDLRRFVPQPAPSGPFTVLFASSPDLESWLEGRGIPLLLDAASRRPHMRFRMLWRPWGNSVHQVRRWIAERNLHNVELIVERASDMARHHQNAHVTVAPFTDPQQCKAAPNSLIESLACGRPVLVTSVVGLAELIAEHRGGLVSETSGEALAEQLDRLQSDWAIHASAARRLAEQCFATPRFLQAYERLYADTLGRPAKAA